MKYYSVIIILFALALNSCKKTDTSSNFNENLKIKMYETVDSTKKTLFFKCFTEKIFECSNYSIQATYKLTNDKITINFIQIEKPNICLTSVGPASTLIKLEGLTNKLYEVELNFGATKITGQLNISASSFKATLPTQTKVQFVNPDLGRIPNNTIYGKVHYHTAATTSTVQKFIDSLQFYGAISTLYPQGDYVNFQIESNGQIKQVQDLGYYFTRYYIFNYSNNSGQINRLIKRVGISYANDVLITLNTAKGETFTSWTP